MLRVEKEAALPQIGWDRRRFRAVVLLWGHEPFFIPPAPGFCERKPTRNTDFTLKGADFHGKNPSQSYID